MLESGANIDSITRAYADPLEEKDVRDLPADKLLPSYIEAFKDIPAGGYTPVFKLESPADPLRSKYAVALVTDRQAGRGVQVRGSEGQTAGAARGPDGHSSISG